MKFKHLTKIVPMLAMLVTPLTAYAQPDYTDTEYWNRLCTDSANLSDADQQACAGYMNHMRSENTDLQNRINAIDAEKSQLSGNVADYEAQIAGYNRQLTGLNSMMADLNAQIDAAQSQLEETKAAIAENEELIVKKKQDVDALKEKVKNRICDEQPNMRVSSMIDVLMGAKSFTEFIRIANGIIDITEYDNHTLGMLNTALTDLNNLQDQMKTDEETLLNTERDLETGRQALASQQTELLAAKYEADMVRSSYEAQLNDVNNQLSSIQTAINANNNTIDSINDAANKPTSSLDTATPTPSATVTTPSETTKPINSPRPSPTPTPQTGGSNPYYGGWGNCTWGAWQLAYDNLGVALPGWGYPASWISDAQRSGYATGSTPAVNAIAVYSYHVAFVAAVDGDRVFIKEGNYLGSYHERWVSAYELPGGQTCLGYIYL